MKYYLIAGEASGDLHGSNLIKALKQSDPEAEIFCWGGDLMEAAGATVIKHYRDLAFMGFWEVLKNLRTILGNIRFCKTDLAEKKPDALVLIDYPGFNLRMAAWAAPKGIPVYYYISPQLWAWHSSRVKQIKAFVRKMYVILPFEADFYQKHQYQATYVGHPLLDVVTNFEPDPDFAAKQKLLEKPVIALLPGSRKQEIQRMLEVMLAMVPLFPDYSFVLAGAPSMPERFYREIIAETGSPDISFVSNQTYQLLSVATAALVTSGTATLETALFKVPQIVCYKGSELSYQIARRVVDLKYISLVNLIVDAPLVKELIQDEFNPDQLSAELRLLLTETKQQEIQQGYTRLREILGNEGASSRTAASIVADLKQSLEKK
jgi:lipid-A-disaccharide synthase